MRLRGLVTGADGSCHVRRARPHDEVPDEPDGGPDKEQVGERGVDPGQWRELDDGDGRRQPAGVEDHDHRHQADHAHDPHRDAGLVDPSQEKGCAQRDEPVGQHEPEGGERTGPAGAVDRALLQQDGEYGDGEHRDGDDPDRHVRRLSPRVRPRQRRHTHPVVGHGERNPGEGVDAGERAGEHADRDADVDHDREPAEADQVGQVGHRCRALGVASVGRLVAQGL